MAAKTLLNFLIFLLVIIRGGNSAVTFNIVNNCLDSVWLASSPGNGDSHPEKGSKTLEKFFMPDPWNGSIWARTKCITNDAGYFSCETGDCKSGTPNCQGPPPTYPVSLLNFNIQNNVVTYEASTVHGYNLGVRITPIGGSLVDGGSGSCPDVGCFGKMFCLEALVAANQDGMYIGCNSPCDAFKNSRYCCGQGSCNPNEFTDVFKQPCNLAHAYPGDKDPPLYKCSGATAYNVTFCPAIDDSGD